jgi:chorismate mutase/prephenate dehydratase
MAKQARRRVGKSDGKSPRRGSDADRSSASISHARKPTLAELRSELDHIDHAIVAAINRRAEVAQQIGELKRDDGRCVFDPERETEVLRQAIAANTGPLNNDAVRAIFRELISGSRAVQSPLRVAYLGPEFTFSHLAAIEGFGQSAELVPVGTIAAVFEEVERGQTQYGVVPMENSTDGRVSDTLECFARSHVRICAGLPLRIHHCLLGIGSRDQVRTVYSKPQPLSQCRNWLARHLPNVTLHEVGSTAEASRRAKEDASAAAVASAQAGVHYGLPVLVQNIEDNAENVTRFAVISTRTGDRTGKDKTALMFEIPHQPGALADALAIFKRNRLNMTWLESFPIPGSLGTYLFFLEFAGHQNDSNAQRAIAALVKSASRIEVLGSYAQTEPIG